jgi:adenine-specific DNA-methyltransferase
MRTKFKDKKQSDLQLSLIEPSDLHTTTKPSFFHEINGLSTDISNGGNKYLLQIQNRRYLGNKYKLLPLLKEIVKQKCNEYDSLCDIFAGTGVVGYAFNNNKIKIISNELLFSNYISLYAWLSSEPYDRTKIENILSQLNAIKGDKDNYVSDNFGNRYFSLDNARKIGEIRESIEKMSLSFKEKSILLTSLLYAIDKSANTCGHYDAFRKNLDTFTPIKLLLPDIKQEINVFNELFNEDANKLIRKIEADILYIDPPYNSRQYSDTYHLLENIIRWEKPIVHGKARKMNRSNLKSMYCTKEATRAFCDLVMNAKCKYILFSYNNMSEKGNMRSNARINDKVIIEILEKRGKVEIYEQEYKPFTTGKSTTEDHSERVFFCKVMDK